MLPSANVVADDEKERSLLSANAVAGDDAQAAANAFLADADDVFDIAAADDVFLMLQKCRVEDQHHCGCGGTAKCGEEQSDQQLEACPGGSGWAHAWSDKGGAGDTFGQAHQAVGQSRWVG
jgi:hypothetical protein